MALTLTLTLTVGTLVEFTNLKSRPELNGQGGTVRFFIQESGRYSVKLVKGGALAVKSENLILPLAFYDQDASGARP